MTHWTIDKARKLDAHDPLAPKRAFFEIPEGVIYLDGNSLGVLPTSVPDRVQRVVQDEWGKGLIRSWNDANWMSLPSCVGARIARLIGAAPGSVVAADSTSVNLFKMVVAARRLRPGRSKILTETGNFPTDIYVLQGISDLLGAGTTVEKLTRSGPGSEHVLDALDQDTAVLCLTHVDFRTGTFHDMAAVTAKAHEVGALVVWDLAHSAGALPVDMTATGADFAVGCGYKYLNGGPGAPAFLYVAPQHQNQIQPPLSGWMGHAKPFDFGEDYTPAPGVARNLCGTPVVLGLSILDEALKVFGDVDMLDVRAKSMAMGDMFIELVEARLAGHGFTLVSPREGRLRGSQVSFASADGYAIVQALIERGVIGDFRAPNIMRFGFTPLYLSYEDIYRAVEALEGIMDSGVWRDEKYSHRNAVT